MRSVVFPFQHRLQAVEVLLVGGEAEGAELVGRLGTVELLVPSEMRLVAAGGQCDGQPVPRFDDVLDHDSGIGLNRLKDTFIGIVRALRAVHHKDPPPANAKQISGASRKVLAHPMPCRGQTF